MARSSLATARLQIAAAFLEPALRFARLAGLSLDELQELTTEGYFRELQQQGMSWTAIARRMGKSRSTVAALANCGYCVSGACYAEPGRCEPPAP